MRLNSEIIRYFIFLAISAFFDKILPFIYHLIDQLDNTKMITLLCSKAKVTYILPGQFAITQLSSAINKILLIIETESHSFKLYSQQSALLAANNSMPSRVTSYQCYQTGIRYHVNNQFFPIKANMAKKYKSLNFSGFNRRISNFLFL